MGRVTIRDVGQYGIITDIPYHELPPEAWSDGYNVSFRDKKAVRPLGETTVFGTLPVGIAPKFLFPSPNATQAPWVYTTNAKAYAVVGTSHFDITRLSGDYTASDSSRWNGDWVNGVLILNNGVDDPQQWLPISTAQRLVVLANWPANTKAAVIRQFKNFVFALDVTKAATRYPTMVKWSHPADPGAVPVTWDPADATKLAGEVSLSETPGFILDGSSLGSYFIIGKEDAIFRAIRIQTNDVFDFKPLTKVVGWMAQGCGIEFQPGKMFIFAMSGDCLVTDGQTVVSVLDEHNRSTLERRIDGTNRRKCFVTVNQATKEVYVAYPLVGSSYCNEMAVWDWVRGTWSFRACSPTLDIKAGIYDESVVDDTWDSDNATWDSDNTVWDERLYTSGTYKLLGAYPTVPAIRQFGRGQKLGTTAYGSRLERQGLSIIGTNRDGSPRNDPNATKQVTEVYPLMSASSNMTMKVYVGGQDRPKGPISWDGPYNFNPRTMEKVDCLVEGRYIGVRFESDDEVEWEMEGYGLKVDVVGEYL